MRRQIRITVAARKTIQKHCARMSQDLEKAPVELLKDITADDLQIASQGLDPFHLPVRGQLPRLCSASANLSLTTCNQCALRRHRSSLDGEFVRSLQAG